MDMHFMFLTGRATKEPEVLETKKGKEFRKFSIAINIYKGKDLGSEPYFYDVVCFSQRLQDIASRITKGDSVYVSGQPEVFAFQGEDGESKARVSLKAEQIKVFNPTLGNIGDQDGD